MLSTSPQSKSAVFAVKRNNRSAALACSTAALARLALMPGRAGAQLPAGCVSNGANPNQAASGDTVTCLSPPTPIGPLVLDNVTDLTVVIGGAAATEVTGVEIEDVANFTLELAAGSAITGGGVSVSGASGTTSISTAGTVTGLNGTGIFAISANTGGAGGLTITAGDVTGSANGIYAERARCLSPQCSQPVRGD